MVMDYAKICNWKVRTNIEEQYLKFYHEKKSAQENVYQYIPDNATRRLLEIDEFRI
jgi:hypothetical protein